MANEVINLGVIMDSQFKGTAQAKDCTKKATSALCQIGRARKYLSQDATLCLVRALALSKLYYCITVYGGMLGKDQELVQRALNFAAKMVLGGGRRDSARDHLNTLGWLRVVSHLRMQDVILAHRCILGMSPPGNQDLFSIEPVAGPRNPGRVLAIRTRTQAGRSGVRRRAADAYNTLPLDIQEEPALKKFKNAVLDAYLAEQRAD
jgi:hypothetical protein